MPGELDEEGHDATDRRRGVARTAREDPGARFYAAAGRSPAETTLEVRDRIVRLIVRAAEAGRRQPDVTPDAIRRVHRALFGDLFPFDAGRFRQPGEDVVFPVLSIVGGKFETTLIHGADPDDIERRLATACDAFNAAASPADRGWPNPDADAAARALAALVAEVLVIHPFVDGNHRVAYVLLQLGFMRLCGEALLLARERARFEECFELALLGTEHRTPLANFLASRLREALG